MTNRYPIGEIDLAELLVAIVKTVQRNFWLILTCVVVCTTASIGLHYARPYVPAFESSMLIYTNRAGESYSSRAAFGFSQLRVASDSVKAARLHLDTEIAGKLVDVRFDMEVTNADKETKVEDQFFVLTAVVRDPSILPQLQGALVDYLHDNTFIRQREEQRRKGFEEMLTRIDADIARLDSMKTLIGKGRLKLPVGTTLIDPADPYTSSIGLYQKHADLIYELGRVKSIQMVEGFGPAVESVRPSVKRFVLAGIIIGVLLAVLIMFVRFTRDLVRRSESTQAPS